ncbi:MAG TPA: hypothetical protein VFC25_14340 [Verrucomicrobiae bacterium]|nr:hypothetical protein [Verrucomicrobiae bacterium]
MTNGIEVVKSGGALRRGLLFALLLVTAWAVPAKAHDRGRPAAAAGGPCTTTAATLYGGCLHQVEADGAVAKAICINISDAAERGACVRDADAAQDDGEALCRDQLAGRRDACVLLGDVRYDPDPEPADFETDFAHLAHPNRYFPLRPGNRWVYGGSEDDVVEMTTATKSIDDLTCLVSHDTVRENGVVTEDTFDWFAQRNNGDVFYCGESTAEYETFEGDHPMTPELVTIDGTFKQGRDGDQGGLIFPGSPHPGLTYREESSFTNAEDIAQVVSTTYTYGASRDLDRLVPKALAQLLCHGDCVVTKNTSLLEPGIVEFKYYAPGLGVFLEVHPADKSVLQLVSCNFDPRCASLPQP